MSLVSKRQATSDRISNLPTNLIIHILSLLSTKDAVKTSALSSYWNQQWTSITHLDFDDGCPIIGQDYDPASGASFVKFVYRVLLFRVTCLDSFRFRSGRYYDVTHVSTWLSVALSRNVREIDLTVHMEGSRLLPVSHCLFSSRTLVVLKLGKGFLLEVPNIISLESLKTLHLCDLEFDDGESLSRLVSSSPVLEELRIEGMLSESINVLKISSPLLKRLILIGLYELQYSEIGGFHSYEVVLDTPSLEYLEHVDEGVPDGYRIETPHSLDTAWLCMHLSSHQFLEYDDPLTVARSMADLAVAISNVQVLYLSEYAFEAFYRLDCAPPILELPKFDHLTDLKIGAIATDEGLTLLKAFLHSSPQLSYLSFALDSWILSLTIKAWDPPSDVPFCMLYNLKEIELGYFKELEPGLSMVKYFLEKTNCLEELVIPWINDKNEEFIEEVLKLPRASKSCRIRLT